VESVRELLNRIAKREGYFGNLLAEGVMRASQRVGSEAANWAVYAQKRRSARPRSSGKDALVRAYGHLFRQYRHHRGDMGRGAAGTGKYGTGCKFLLTRGGLHVQCQIHNGIRQFDDCVGTCRLVSPAPKIVLECFNAATGWNWTLEDAFTLGLRVINQLRVFNFRHGLKKELEPNFPKKL